MEDAVAPSRRPRTREHYDYVRRRLLDPYLGKARLDRLTAADIQRALSAMERDGRSARQREAAFTILRGALQQAVK